MTIKKNAILHSCAIALAAEDNDEAVLARAQQILKPLSGRDELDYG